MSHANARRTCDICTLGYCGEKCPNGWLPNEDGDLIARKPGMHEAARVHVVRHREAMAALQAARRGS